MFHTQKAFAKINLALFITNKLPNGYHTLETIFAPINWFDTISFSESAFIEMTCSNSDLPVDENNLCIKAAKMLKEKYNVQNGIAIHLEKNIPFGAGLGGGSSNAAATLNYLNQYWELDLAKETLSEIALKLGADVPFFLKMKSLAFAEGIGERLTDLKHSFPFPIVTAFPEQPISTAWAYQLLNLNFPRNAPNTREALKNLIETGDIKLLNHFENDFESIVLKNFPMVQSLKERLSKLGAIKTLMSGSGSAVFGIFENETSAKICFEVLSQEFPASYTPSNFVIT